MPYTFNKQATHNQQVGQLNLAAIKALLGLDYPEDIVWMYPGAIRHADRRHPGDLDAYGHLIPSIIAHPDYIGQNPTEPGSIELYKVVETHLILAIKLDPSGYLYLSSFYELKNGANKITKRLESGRVVEYKTTDG